MAATGWAALALACAGALGGLLGPWLIARVPEPVIERADPAESGDKQDEAPAKELYRDIAALPRVGIWLAMICAVSGALVGWQVGWHGGLLLWGYLVPVGTVLALVDWRTRLLPTYLIAPSYGVLVGLTLIAALLDHDRHALVGAGLGWLVVGGFYLLMWLIYPKGMGYGDVRLSGLLGIALGYLGWPQILVGAYAGLLVGSLGGFALSRLRIVESKRVPFGPFMVLGAVLGVLIGPAIASGLGY